MTSPVEHPHEEASNRVRAGAARYDWFYVRNPAGAGTQFLLRQGSDGPWVGALGVGRREFWCGPRRVTAGVLVDFIIAPAHRVFYPALLLQRTARQHELGPCTVILAHPNQNSAGVILRAGPTAKGTGERAWGAAQTAAKALSHADRRRPSEGPRSRSALVPRRAADVGATA